MSFNRTIQPRRVNLAEAGGADDLQHLLLALGGDLLLAFLLRLGRSPLGSCLLRRQVGWALLDLVQLRPAGDTSYQASR